MKKPHSIRLFLFLFILIPSISFAQRNKHYKWELGVDLGATNFLGDLGGANQIGTHLARDLEFSLTRPAFGVHIRYRKQRYFGYKAEFCYGKVFGDDQLTQERFRNNRNLNFKSNIFEFSTQFEFYFSKERPGHIYHYKKLHGWKNIDMQEYIFIGIGGFHFNPKGYWNGTFTALRPLRTEGEGLIPGTKMYSLNSICFPMGAGFKYGLNRRFSIGVEYGLRYTITDYIDDVSTNYADPAIIAAGQPNPQMAALAVHFADPSLGLIPPVDGIYVTGVGQVRGHSDHTDAYMFAVLTVNYKLGKIKRTHSKF
ncbi:MAG TPA: DUF6089 family protein [Bacteroidia bacterium]|jgi:hypothetical protein|nr:DUF6089 family protein [Bacteroidia bacterium]